MLREKEGGEVTMKRKVRTKGGERGLRATKGKEEKKKSPNTGDESSDTDEGALARGFLGCWEVSNRIQ